MAKQKEQTEDNLEKKLWKTADKLRKNIDAAEYKHVVLGLIFLKYISDAFDELHQQLIDGQGNYAGADPEDPDEYGAENVFFVPEKARWKHIQSMAKTPGIGKLIDDAMDLIEAENAVLKGILPKVYGSDKFDAMTLGGLIDTIGTIALGDSLSKSQDVLGRVYEYFLGQFALAEGQKGGQFYTPESIVKLLIEMLQPYKGRVYDPCCGSGGMFVQSEKFIESHQGRLDDISVYGQESNQTTYRLCRMNLAIRGIDGSNIKWNTEGSFLNNAHKDLKADYIIANPPFNVSDWSGELLNDDARWQYGTPPAGNANFAWVQHFLYHLAPNGKAGFVLANGSLSSNTGGEGEIRKRLVEADLVECIVMLPKALFFNTGIPACLWFLHRNKKKRNGEVLFIDASNLGMMIDRKNRIFEDKDVQLVADTYHNWLSSPPLEGDQGGGLYEDIKGFCKSANLSEIEKHKFVLTPGRYVGIEDEEDDGIPFEEKIQGLTNTLREQMTKAQELDNEIKEQLAKIGIQL